MTPQSMFHNLAKTIPERERKELLNRIHRSLSLKSPNDDSVHRTRMPDDERAEMIRQEINSLGTVGKFMLWFRHLVSNAPKEKIYESYKLKEIKKSIKRHPGIVNFDYKTCTPKFGEYLYMVYESVYPLMSFFKYVWKDGSFFEGMLMFLLGARLRDLKNGTTDLVSMEELKRIYLLTERKEDIRNEIMNKLNQYIQSIPSGVFQEIEEGLLPLYYFRELVLFPFSPLFAAFRVTVGEDVVHEHLNFKAASLNMILDNLELLYYAMYVAQKINRSMFFFKEIFEYRDSLLSSEDSPEDDNNSLSVTSHEVRENLLRCQSATDHFLQRIPLADIIRYFRNDPYYRMMFYLPNPKLKDFYHSALKIKIIAEFDMMFNTLRHSVVEDLIKILFHGQPLEDLRYYTEYPDFNWKKLGLSYFTQISTMRILYTYLSRIYRQKTRNLLELIGKKVVLNRRELQNNLLLHGSSLEDLIDKIRSLDYSLAPESDDGKTFARLRYSLVNDLSQNKFYETLIAQKDREARDLIEKGFEHFDGLLKCLNEVRMIIRNITPRKTSTEDDAGSAAIEKKLIEQVEEIKQCKKLLIETRSLEAFR